MRIIFQILMLIMCFSYFNTLSFSQALKNNCSICLEPLLNNFSIDAWDNFFHTHHIKEGDFEELISLISKE